MTVRGSLQKTIQGYEADPEFEFEELLLHINEQIVTRLQAHGMRRSQLAEELGVSRAFVTKLLSGEENATIKTLVRVANALDAKVSVQIQERTASMRLEELRESSRPATRGLKGRRPAAATRSRR